MVRSLDAATQSAVANRSAVVVRNLVYLWSKSRVDASLQPGGLWDDPEDIVTNVVAGEDGSSVSRTYAGGAIVRIGQIPLKIGLEVRTLEIELNPLHASVIQLLRTYDARLARVEVHRGYFDPGTRLLVAEPRCRFMGQVNEVEFNTAAAGGESGVSLRLVSHTRELTRTNPARKSDEQQKLRSGDRFRRYAGVAHEWPIWWGEEKKGGSTAEQGGG